MPPPPGIIIPPIGGGLPAGAAIVLPPMTGKGVDGLPAGGIAGGPAEYVWL